MCEKSVIILCWKCVLESKKFQAAKSARNLLFKTYASGSLEGNPAFLGYFFAVGFTFLITTKERSISVSISGNFTTEDFYGIFGLGKFLVDLTGFIGNKAPAFFYKGDAVLGKST